MYSDHFLNWKKYIYINQNNFHHFVQNFQIFLATWQYRVERTTLFSQRFNPRLTFALYHYETAWQPSFASSIRASGDQKVLRLMSTLGSIQLPIGAVTMYS